MIAEKERLDKYLGCLLGGAIGDALGAPIEFLSYESILAKYGAITGNLVGLIVGKNQIPQEWIENLKCREIVEEVAHDLFIKCASLTVEVDKAWHDKYPGY